MASFEIFTEDGIQYVECRWNGKCERVMVTHNVTAAKMRAYAKIKEICLD